MLVEVLMQQCACVYTIFYMVYENLVYKYRDVLCGIDLGSCWIHSREAKDWKSERVVVVTISNGQTVRQVLSTYVPSINPVNTVRRVWPGALEQTLLGGPYFIPACTVHVLSSIEWTLLSYRRSTCTLYAVRCTSCNAILRIWHDVQNTAKPSGQTRMYCISTPVTCKTSIRLASGCDNL